MRIIQLGMDWVNPDQIQRVRDTSVGACFVELSSGYRITMYKNARDTLQMIVDMCEEAEA